MNQCSLLQKMDIQNAMRKAAERQNEDIAMFAGEDVATQMRAFS